MYYPKYTEYYLKIQIKKNLTTKKKKILLFIKCRNFSIFTNLGKLHLCR